MAAIPRYTCTFDNIQNGSVCLLEIYDREHNGPTIVVEGSTVPVRRLWSTDDPTAPIRGQSLDIRLINEAGALPLSSFYSNDDNRFTVKYYIDTVLKFIGFLVQDDFSEEMVDFTHEIKLTATDNLGLLKEVQLIESKAAYINIETLSSVPIVFTAPNVLSGLLPGHLQIGDRIVLIGGPFNNELYTISTVPSSIVAILDRPITAGSGIWTTVSILRRKLAGRYSFAEIINFALRPTGILIQNHVYSQIKPVGGTTGRWLEDTYIDASSFFDGNNWDKCYTVLEKILKRFKATLFQANGFWNIVRWDELRQNAGLIPGYAYRSDLVYDHDIALSDIFTAGVGELTFAETGITQSLTRPDKFVREQFDYKQPGESLKNASFGRLGNFITSYPSGPDTVSEYEMADWDVGHEWNTAGTSYVASSASRFIRVVRNAAGDELEKYGVIKGAYGFDPWACAESMPIELNKGNRISISFDFKASTNWTGSGAYFRMTLITNAFPYTPRAANNRYLSSTGLWTHGGSISLLGVSISPTESYTDWHTITVESEEVPFDGVFFFKLSQIVPGAGAGDESHYKNISFKITQFNQGTLRAIGQMHTDTQPVPDINNIDEVNIDIDDSPGNPINGTLFLSSFTGPVQNRILKWQVGTDPNEYNLGNITTLERLFIRRIQRIKLEGNLYGLKQSSADISPIVQMLYTYFPDTIFLFGSCEIDDRNGFVKGTLWEWYKDTETDSDLTEIYEFKYLYDK